MQQAPSDDQILSAPLWRSPKNAPYTLRAMLNDWLAAGGASLLPNQDYPERAARFAQSRLCEAVRALASLHEAGPLEDLVTPERKAKGDLEVHHTPEGAVSHAQAQVRNILNHLWEKGVLDAQHVHDGQVYEVWQLCFTAHLGYRNNPIYRSEVVEYKAVLRGEGLEAGDFEKLIRLLSLEQKQAVEAAIYTPASEHVRWQYGRNHAQFREAFDRLSEVMERLRDDAARRGDEGLPPAL
jgi:hypothetical protein